ncbi:MAG: hypothetical protein AABY22_24700 [Nanoarchaeota archaeon]
MNKMEFLEKMVGKKVFVLNKEGSNYQDAIVKEILDEETLLLICDGEEMMVNIWDIRQ